ncbi:Calx-beta domain-containing protein [Magnetospirillum sp. SS-4]|uniref:Calx-beta domain-containing protein n=1 Tax=Magnetospirillum sp. SS-4 TaxID=2681465 RepID=UPI00137CE414|nr:Calx-beta domain-containing protein [Magnetospirillum sp. SS-4]CAA7619034.1 Integrins alpha chain:Na-Ca exchanger/integrin-beta4 [Magnetospirillum sp. SS-4]
MTENLEMSGNATEFGNAVDNGVDGTQLAQAAENGGPNAPAVQGATDDAGNGEQNSPADGETPAEPTQGQEEPATGESADANSDAAQAGLKVAQETFTALRGTGADVNSALNEAADAARQEALRTGATNAEAELTAIKAREALSAALSQGIGQDAQGDVRAAQSDFTPTQQSPQTQPTPQASPQLTGGGADRGNEAARQTNSTQLPSTGDGAGFGGVTSPATFGNNQISLGSRQTSQSLGIDSGLSNTALVGQFVTQKLGVGGSLFAPAADPILANAAKDAAQIVRGATEATGQNLNQVGGGQVIVEPSVSKFNPTGNEPLGNVGDPVAKNPVVNTVYPDAQVSVRPGQTVLEGGIGSPRQVTFQIERSNAYSAGSVSWSVSGLSADDFAGGTIPQGVASFGTGEISKTVTLNLAADRAIEKDEVITLSLGTPSGKMILNPTGIRADATVSNDDGIAWVTAAATSAREGAAGQSTVLSFVVNRTEGSGASSVGWRVTGLDAADFGGTLPSGTVQFANGETSKTVTVSVPGDNVVEADSTVVFELHSPDGNLTLDGTQWRAQMAFADDDTGGYSIAAASADKAEGANGQTTPFTFTVTRSVGVDAPASINYRLIQVGTNFADASDFAAGQDGLGSNGGLPSGTVSFQAGESSKTITVNVVGDNAKGSDESFALVLANPPAGTRILQGEAAAVIRNDDSTFAISTISADKNEGNGGATAYTFLVTRSGDTSASQTVNYAVQGHGEAPANSADFGGSLPSGTVTFAAGETTATVTVSVSGDSQIEGQEGFRISLLSPSSNSTILASTAIGTIQQDDSTIAIHALDAVKVEGATAATGNAHSFVITRGGNLAQSVQVSWAVQGTGDNPVNAADFGGTLPSGTVSFAVGETSKTISFTPSGDLTYEQSESYAVVVSTAQQGVAIVTSSASGLLVNDEIGLTVTATDLVKAEGDSGNPVLTFTVTRSGVIQNASTVDWAVVATGADGVDTADFVAGVLPSGTLSFAAGEQSLLVTLPITTDAVVEANEGFVIRLSNASVGSQVIVNDAVGTILNDDALFSVAADASSIAEGQSGVTQTTFRITRSGDTSGVDSVNYSVTGSGANAASAADFQGGSLPSGTVTFQANETEKLVTINIATDSVIEAAEQFTLSLSSPSAGSLVSSTASSATVTITNDDDQLSIAASSADAAEGGTGGGAALTFTVTRTGDTSTTSTANWAVAGQGANPASAGDFQATSGTVTFDPGVTSRTITVNVAGDYSNEADEAFTITLSGASAGTTLGTASANGVIRNDDTGLAIAATTTNLTEGDSGSKTHVFTVTRSGIVTGATTVDWSIGGAVDASDFAVTSGTVSFGAGETSKTIQLQAQGDTDIEANEAFTVTLANASSNAHIQTATANGTIVSDDSGLAISAVAATVNEGANGSGTTIQFTVTRSGNTAGTSTANWSLSGDVNAADFGGTLPSGTVTFNPGVTTQTISLSLSGDDAVEADEGITVTLSSPSAGTAITTASASTTVINDDTSLALPASVGSLAEGADSTTAQIVVTVTRAGRTDGATTAQWRMTGGTANANDFQTGQDALGDNGGLPSGTVTFAAGETTKDITLVVKGDGAVEADETVQITLSDPGGNVEVVTGTVTATITNDDVGFSIAALDAVKAEGNSGTTSFTFTVTRAGSISSAATVDYAVLAAASGDSADGSDFPSGFPSGTVSFAANQSQATLTIQVSGDTVVETDEGFRVQLSNAKLADNTPQTIITAEASGTIRTEDVTYSVAANQASWAEGNSGATTMTFTVTRSGDTSEASTVAYALTSPNGGSGADLSGGVLPSGTISFGVGETSKTVTVDVVGDTVVETDEIFTLTLSSPSKGVVTGATASATVTNDDSSFAISANSANHTEGHSGSSNAVFTVTRSGDLSQAATVTWAAQAGNGIDAADFGGSVPSGTLNFAANQSSATISVGVTGDTTVENDETLSVTISGASIGTITNATASTTIIGDDDSFSIAADTASVAEGHSGTNALTFTVTRTGPAHGAKTVNWAASGLSANDFVGNAIPNGTLTFADGVTSQTITINLAADTTVETDEVLTVSLSSPSTGATLATSSATTTVTNDDAQVAVTAQLADKAEGNTGTVPFTFEVTRSGFLTQSSSVQWRLTGTGSNDPVASDFATGDTIGDNGGLPSGTVSFASGETTKTITIQVAADSILENNETFQVALSNSSTGTVVGGSAANGTIQNDDAELNFTGSTSLSYAEGDSGSVAYAYTITRSGNTSQISTVNVGVSGDLSVGEYTLSAGSITFASGETSKTVTVNVNGDNSVESNESFAVSLSGTSAGTSIGATGSATGTVLEDDTGVTITGGTISKAEGKASESDTYSYTLTRTGSTREATFNLYWGAYDPSGSLEDPAAANDFSSAVVSRQGGGTDSLTFGNYTTVTFVAGEMTKTVTVTTTGDNTVENDEWFRLFPASGGATSVDYSGGEVYGELLRDESGIRSRGAVASVGSQSILSSITEGDTAADGGSGATTTVTWWFDRLYSTSGTASFDWYVSPVSTNADDWAAGQDSLGTKGGYPSGTVTFADGEANAYVTFNIATDNIGELGEDFRVFAENPSGGSSISESYNSANIVNDDTVFTVGSNGTVDEPVSGTANVVFTINRDGDTRGTDTVDWSIVFPGSETGNEAIDTPADWYKLDPSDVDLASVASTTGTPSYDTNSRTLSGTLTFANGQTSQTVTLPILADTLPESWREYIEINLSNAQNVNQGEAQHDLETPTILDSTASAWVFDNEPGNLITVVADKTSFYEGTDSASTVTFTLTRSVANGGSIAHPITVGWEIKNMDPSDSGESSRREDVTSVTGDSSISNHSLTYGNYYGAVTFGANETTKTVTVTFVNDVNVESDDQFQFSILSPRDTTEYPWSSTYAGESSAYNGENYGSAGVDTDNNPDTSNAADNPLSITILNDDTRLWLSGQEGVSTPSLSITEGDSGTKSLSVTLVRYGRLDTDITLSYTLTNGTTSNADWAAMTGTVTVPGGSSNPVLTLPLIASDTDIENNESFTLTFTNSDTSVRFGRNADNLSNTMAISGTLANDDTTYAIVANQGAQVETDQGQYATYTYTVTRAANGYTGASTVEWRVTGTGANPADATDFATSDALGNNGGRPSGTVSFGTNEFSKTVTILVRGDITAENSETFQVALSNPSLGLVGSGTANSTITTDDTGIAIADGGTITEGDSGSQNVTFTVTRSGDLTVTSTMNWAVTHQSTDAADFTGATSGSLTFSANESSKTITVAVAGDNELENDETFSVLLSGFTNVDEVLDNTGTATIANSDASFSIAATSANGLEGAGGQTFTITRDRSTAQNQTISWQVQAVADGAVAADFGGSLPSGTVTFAPGELTKTITVTPTDDAVAEGDEAYNVTISGGAGTTGDTITTATAGGTIRNDDAAVAIEQVVTSQAEGHGDTTYSFTVRRTGNTTGTASVNWAVTGSGADPVEGADFSGGALPSGTVNFADGEAVKTITLTVAGDSVVENEEGFTVTLSNPVNATIVTASTTGAITNDDATIAIAATDADKAEGNSGQTPFTFTITRTGFLGTSASVNWAVTSAQADGTDFSGGALPSGVATFASGAATATVTVNVQGDVTGDGDEAFTVTLSNPPSGITVSTATATGTIRTDDIVFAVASPGAVLEGDSGTTNFDFVVTRSGDLSGSQTLTWTVAGTGADPASAGDFGATTGTITFNASDTTKTISVPVAGDTAGEANEGFRLTLTGPGGVVFTNNTADATITDDEASLRVSALDAVKYEGGSGTTTDLTFRVTRSGNTSSAVTADWAVVNGTTDGTDFTGTTTGTVSFASGETEKIITVTVQGDVSVEASEAFSVQLSNASAGADIITASASGTIRSDDTHWSLSLVSSATQMEGDATGTTFTYRVTRDGGLNAGTVDWSLAGQGADAATVEDFGGTFPSGTVTFADGEATKDFTVTVLGDNVLEADQGFRVSIANPTGTGVHTLGTTQVDATIANDDDTLAITASSLSATEGDSGTSALTFTVTRTGSLSGTSTTGWRIKAGSDTDASDFAATSGTITFADGESSKTVSLALNGDTTVESAENFTVELYNPGAGSVITTAEATGTITDNDIDLTLTGSTTSIMENASVRELVYTVTRTGRTDGVTTVNWAVSGTGASPVSAADFSGSQDILGTNGGLPSGTVTFAAGETVKQITVIVADDGAHEANETLTLSLASPSGNAEIAANNVGGTILNDDDSLAVVAVDADKQEGASSAITNFTFRIDRTGSLDGTASVNWAVAGIGSHPVSSAEFVASSGTVAFADGQSSALVTVAVRGDAVGEFDENFRITLSDASFGSNIIGATANGTVRNDDPALSITADQASKAEGSGDTTFSFTVTRTGSTAGVSSVAWAVQGSGTDAANVLDFGGYLPSGTVTFAAGESTKTINVTVVGDTVGEKDETFSVVLSGAVGADIILDRAQTTITNDDTALSIAATSADKAEGDSGTTPFTFTVTRSGLTSGASSVDWAVTGSGDFWADATDFAGNVLPSGSLNFADGESTKTITVNVAGDATAGQNEGFTVTLSNASSATVINATASGTIRNDDSEIAINTLASSVAEGNSGTTALTFQVTRTGDTTRSATVDWQVVGAGEAQADGTDFVGGTLPTGSVTFAAGESTKTVTVQVAGDATAENTETFNVELVNPGTNVTISAVSGSAQGAILADDVGLSIVAVAANKAEGRSSSATPFTFKVFRTGASDSAVTINYAVTGIGANAANAADFSSAMTGSVVLAAGVASTLISLDVAADTVAEADETFRITISATGASILTGTADGTIVDDDSGFSVTVNQANQAEGGTGAVTEFVYDITRAGDATAIQTVNWALTGLGASAADATDFVGGVLPSGSLTFASGETSKQVAVQVAGDTDVEAAENFRMTISGGAGIVIVDATADAVIAADDSASANADRLMGTSSPDVLDGLAGDDLLYGGQGYDVLTGGAGADLFHYESASEGGDTILDFVSGTDRITYVASAFGNIGAGGNPIDVASLASSGTLADALSAITAHADSDFYRLDFASGTFRFGTGASGELDNLEAAMTTGSHTGAAFFLINDGGSQARLFYDADTNAGSDGSGMVEIAVLNDFGSATANTDEIIQPHASL